MKRSITIFTALFFIASQSFSQTYLTAHHFISAGEIHSMSICNDSTVMSWGYNANGQLGDGINSVADSLHPVHVVTLNGIMGIAGGGWFSLALKKDSTVWAWGYNQMGQIGDGSVFERDSPVQVTGLTGIKTVQAGFDFSTALKSDGTVWAWGNNSSGQLGDGLILADSTRPGQVIGISNVADIASGQFHTLALKYNGSVWAWGGNQNGQLGYGTNTLDSTTAGQVSIITNIIAIGCGYFHSLAVKSDSTVWTWGNNQYGQLGNGSTNTTGCNCVSTLAQVNGLTGVIAVAGGHFHSLALKKDGTVWAWGYNIHGQLGNGNNNESYVPIQVSGLNNVVAISAGWEHSMALKSDGTVWEWGYNLYGQLGNGDELNAVKKPLVQVTILCSVLTSGIDELPVINSFVKAYPNPASSTLTISQTNSQFPLLNSQLLISNILGKEVYSQPINNSKELTIDISKLNNGVYFYQIIIPNELRKETLRGKFVVEK